MNSASFEPRRQDYLELQRRLESLEGVLASVPLGLGLLDTEFRYVWVNPVLASLNCVSQEDHIGRTVREIRTDLPETLEPLLRGISESQGPVPKFTLRGRGSQPFGASAQWTCSLRPLRSSNGEAQGISMVIEPQRSERNDRGITECGSREELDRQRSGFVESLAHELRNPLTAILSAAQMLQRYGATKPEVVDWAGSSIERQVRQMSSGVNDWLDLARAMLGKLELSQVKLDLKPLLAGAIEACRGAAEDKSQTLHADLPCRELWVMGDATRLSQVLQHLLLNAVKFTPSGGRIELASTLEDGNVVFQVRDTGAGLDPGTLEVIFEPFFKPADSSVRRARGMGVGLALSRRLIALQGGTLNVFSQGLGCGTEFVIRLPAVVPPASDDDEQGGRNAPPAHDSDGTKSCAGRDDPA